MMNNISEDLPDHDAYFTPYYGNGLIKFSTYKNFLEFGIRIKEQIK